MSGSVSSSSSMFGWETHLLLFSANNVQSTIFRDREYLLWWSNTHTHKHTYIYMCVYRYNALKNIYISSFLLYSNGTTVMTHACMNQIINWLYELWWESEYKSSICDYQKVYGHLFVPIKKRINVVISSQFYSLL